MAAHQYGPPAVGYAETYIGNIEGLSIGFGMFYGWMESDTTFHIELPKAPKFATGQWGTFVPVAEREDWDTSFTVKLLWQHGNGYAAITDATVVRLVDGSYAVVGEEPDVSYDHAQVKIRETVNRPNLPGASARTYTIEYVGSFELSLTKPDDVPPPGEVDGEAENPTGHEGGFMPVDVITFADGSRFNAITTDDAFSVLTGGLDSFGSSVLDGEDDEESTSTELPA